MLNLDAIEARIGLTLLADRFKLLRKLRELSDGTTSARIRDFGRQVSELAAAGKPSLLVPFPAAADDHQTHNAQAMLRAGAARMVADAELSGERLVQEVRAMVQALPAMGAAARQMSRPGAARRAAEILLEYAS